MINIICEELYLKMMKELGEINASLREAVNDLTMSLTCINNTMKSLKSDFRSLEKIDEKTEIHFFKFQKPRFLAWQIFIVELNQVISSTPKGTDSMLVDYYKHEIEIINRFFRQHAFYHQYYLMNESAMDADLFLIRNRSLFPPGREIVESDDEFSTELDYLFAAFRASDMLLDFLVKRVKLLKINSDQILLQQVLAKKKRSWSGTKMELVEFAYGIYFTRRVNGGKADISDIITWLEDSFSEDLAQAYRMFVDISRRKTISHTNYLDEMRGAIQGHITNSLKYKPQKRRSKN
ncbi:RteC domain-containing protein [Sphingobacterium chungjuense]|uniref:RteC domain-containing protein n=1 Tax=Sphingobacterium chungjuense TaxID=2675553 RepID=UPI00140B9E1D|nr:RteC domain-containing protein [Sphingobacterium chungjuense]